MGGVRAPRIVVLLIAISMAMTIVAVSSPPSRRSPVTRGVADGRERAAETDREGEAAGDVERESGDEEEQAQRATFDRADARAFPYKTVPAAFEARAVAQAKS